jgi:hypothetical protein
MVDIQATSELVKWAVNGVTILLMIIAASLAIKKKNNICSAVVILGNLAAYYFTRSPLICMIISVACIIWASILKGNNAKTKDTNNTEGKKKIKCRFCKKLYSAEYNGCPYCKKV